MSQYEATIEQLREFDFLSEVPDEDVQEVYQRFCLMVHHAEAVHGCDYCDTYRVTLMERETDWEALDRHAAKVSCCGKYDEKITAKSGRIYLIGFNYGH